MNFTREPIIETVITPREGCKLVVRSSKGANQEDYFVDAVEVVSFGHSFFYRSLERPKSFLVPISDYEILELKETRMVLKSATNERSIKIGGGREAPMRPREQDREEMPQPQMAERNGEHPPQERKRDNKRRRGRRGRDRDRSEMPQEASREALSQDKESFENVELSQQQEPPFEKPAPSEEVVKAPSFISKLFPPPPILIKETLSRYKPAETSEEEIFPPSSEEPLAFEEKVSFEETVFEHPSIPDLNLEEDEDAEE